MTVSQEAVVEEENRGLADLREDRRQDDVEHEDPTGSRDGRYEYDALRGKGRSERLDEAVSRLFPGTPGRLAFNYSDSALPIIYIC